jgi:hypothetical protein
MRALCILLVLLAGASLASRAARADGARHTVLRVDGDDVWVDLGTDDGVTAGSELVLHDTVEATHPVTGKKVRDTFEVGRLRVVVAGKKLSVARAADDKAKKRVTAGDEVTLAGAPVAVRDPWDEREAGPGAAVTEAPGGGGAGAASDDAAERARAQALVDEENDVRAAWSRTLGKPPEARIAIWKQHLARWPQGRHSTAVRSEISSLQGQIQAEKRLAEEQQAADEKRADPRAWLELLPEADVVVAGPLVYLPPRRVYQGASFEVSALAVQPGSIRQAWLHVRVAGEATYQRIAMTVEPGGAVRARVSGDKTRPPRVEYFLEVLAAGASEPVAVFGSAEAPASVAVDRSALEPPPDRARRSRVTLVADVVDFDGGFADGHDEYVQLEADFMYRFRGPVHAMRLGFATFAGEGGPKAAIANGECFDEGPMAATDQCRRVAFNYGYVELEFRVSDLVAVMVRGISGGGYTSARPADEEPDFDEFEASLGVRGKVRIGREEETNLAVSAGFVSSVGTLLEAAFTWDVVPRFPIVLSTQVTNAPVGENFGVRLIADVGWRGTDWFYPSLRLAYQARNIELSGVSAGLALNFDW